MEPGSKAIKTFDGADPANFDWYQPVHENGNVLSYPGPASIDPPADLGVFSYTDLAGTEHPDIPAIYHSNVEYLTDDTGGSTALSYSGTLAHGVTTHFDGSLSGSVDIGATFKAKVKVPFTTEDQLGGHVGVALQGSGTLGNTKTENNSTTLSTDITLNRGEDFDTTRDYAYYPIFYGTEDGTLKVAHATNALGSFGTGGGSGWWKSNYGGTFDAALNLPNRFVPLYDSHTNDLVGWCPNDAKSRTAIRGFFVTETDPSFDGTYPALAVPATDGETVRLALRFYNYTKAEGPKISGLPVQFEAVPYDPSGSRASRPARTAMSGSTGGRGPRARTTSMPWCWRRATIPRRETTPPGSW